MSGKAMLTMKRSRLAMNSPTEVIKRTFQRFSMSVPPRVGCKEKATLANQACKRQPTLARLLPMPIEAFARQNCSIARTLSVLGERWTLLVLAELFLGRRRFDEIQAERGIATNILSRRLATLVEEGIAERRRYSEHPE